MKSSLPRNGVSFPALAALGLAAFGAYKYKQSQKSQSAVDGETSERMGRGSSPLADDIDVGTTDARASS